MTKNKKIISLFLAFVMLISSGIFTANVHAAPARPTVYAHAYTIMDANSGEIIMSEQGNKRIYPASTVKLLTAIVAIENCSLSKRITVKQSTIDKIDADTTSANLKAGYSYTLEELLNMLLVYSAGDAAEIIAEAVGGSSAQFVNMMNRKAKALGMNNSYFDNAIGMDWHANPNIYSTANDIAKLTRYAMTNDTIREIVKKPQYVIKNYYNGQSKTLLASNNFLRNYSYSKNLFTIIGSKTGTTDKAGYALATTAKDSSGREVICSFFGKSTRTQMFQDINKLLTYTFNNYKTILQRSFYDIRYSSSKAVINQYLANGVLTMTSTGKFSGSEQVSKYEFVNTTNKALKTSYTTSNTSEKMTLLGVANLFKDYNNKEYSETVKNKYKTVFKNLNSTDFNNMVHLYELNVLPHNYQYNENSKISREEMVLLLSKMPKKVASLKTFPTFTVNTINPTSTTITGKGLATATVRAYVNGRQVGNSATVNSYGNYKITIPKQAAGTKVTVKMSKTGYTEVSKDVVVTLNTFTTFTVNTINPTSTTITGKGLATATVRAYVNGRQVGNSATVNSYGNYKITIPKQAAGTKVTVKMSKTGYTEVSKDVAVTLNTFTTFTVNTINPTSTTITGKGLATATVRAYVNGRQVGNSATVNSYGNYKITIPKQAAGAKVTVKMSKTGYTDISKVISVSLNTFPTFTVNTIRYTSTTITGKGLKTATVRAYVNGRQIGKTVTVDAYGNYKIVIPKQRAKTKVVINMSKTGYTTTSKTIVVK